MRTSILSRILLGTIVSSIFAHSATGCTPILVWKDNYLITFSTDLANADEAKRNCTALGGQLAQITTNDISGNADIVQILNKLRLAGRSSFRVNSGTKAVSYSSSSSWIFEDIKDQTKFHYACKANATVGVSPRTDCKDVIGFSINLNQNLQQLLRKDDRYTWKFSVSSGSNTWKSTSNAKSFQINGLQPSTSYKLQITTTLTGCQNLEWDGLTAIKTGYGKPKPVTYASVADSEACIVKIPAQSYHPELIKSYTITGSNSGFEKNHVFRATVASAQFVKIPTIGYGLSKAIGFKIKPISDHCTTATSQITGQCRSPECSKTLVADKDSVYTFSDKKANANTAEAECAALGGHLAFSTIDEKKNLIFNQFQKKYWTGDMIYMRYAKNDSFITKISITKSAADGFHLSFTTSTCKRDNKCADEEHYYVCQTKLSISATTDLCNPTIFKLQLSNNLENLIKYSGHTIGYQIEMSTEDNSIIHKTLSYFHNNVTITDLQPRSTYFVKVTATFQGCNTFNVTTGVNVTTGYKIPDPIDSAYVNDTAEGCIITIPKTQMHGNVTYYINARSEISNTFHVLRPTKETIGVLTSYNFPLPINAHEGAERVHFEIQIATCEGRSSSRQVLGVCKLPKSPSTQKIHAEGGTTTIANKIDAEAMTATNGSDSSMHITRSTLITIEEPAISVSVLASLIASFVVVVGIAVVVAARLCKRKKSGFMEINAAPDDANLTVQYTPTSGDVINSPETTPKNGDDVIATCSENPQVVDVLNGETQEVTAFYTNVQPSSLPSLQVEESVYAVSSKHN